MRHLNISNLLDSPAEVIVQETSTAGLNLIGYSNGILKEHYPGFYRCMKKYTTNFKQSTLFVGESCCAPNAPEAVPNDVPKSQWSTTTVPAIPPGRKKPLIVAATCLYAPSIKTINVHHTLPVMDNIFKWFWSQDQFKSIGMNPIGLQAVGYQRINSNLTYHFEFWDKYQEEFDPKNPDSRDLYFHPYETTILSKPKVKFWDGEFRRICTFDPWIPALNNKPDSNIQGITEWRP